MMSALMPAFFKPEMMALAITPPPMNANRMLKSHLYFALSS